MTMGHAYPRMTTLYLYYYGINISKRTRKKVVRFFIFINMNEIVLKLFLI